MSTIKDGTCREVKTQQPHHPQHLSWAAGATFKGRLCRDDGIENASAEDGTEGSGGDSGNGAANASLPLNCAGRGGIALKGEWQVADVVMKQATNADSGMLSNARNDSAQPTKHVSAAVGSAGLATNVVGEAMPSLSSGSSPLTTL